MRIVCLIALAAAGCINKYELAEIELDATRVALKAQDGNVSALQSTIRARDLALAARDAKESTLGEEIARLDGEREALMGEKAELLAGSEEMSASIEEMTAALTQASERQAQVDKQIAQYLELVEGLRPLIDAQKLDVRVARGRIVVRLSTDILFKSGSAMLSDGGKQAIIDVATVLARMPDRTYQVEGHSDNVPIRTARYPSNWELAADRAISVLKTMVETGLPAQRASAASFSDTWPVASNDAKEGRAANRRIELVVVPDLTTLPGMVELAARFEADDVAEGAPAPAAPKANGATAVPKTDGAAPAPKTDGATSVPKGDAAGD